MKAQVYKAKLLLQENMMMEVRMLPCGNYQEFFEVHSQETFVDSQEKSGKNFPIFPNGPADVLPSNYLDYG